MQAKQSIEFNATMMPSIILIPLTVFGLEEKYNILPEPSNMISVVFIVTPIVLALMVPFVLMYYILKTIMSRNYIKEHTYKVLNIGTEPKQKAFGAFGQWKAIDVSVQDLKTGKVRHLELYPNLTLGLEPGQEVGIVKRRARNTYEMDLYFLIPAAKFDVKFERKKYMKSVEMEGSPPNGWLIEEPNNEPKG
ncbi:hypothetical protein QTG56_24015 (plasmid) [Rossellomorea sp. AcN35-11]|nr:hypothetical protein [Rossellomorea aquimaris]WJV31705.1 hypothetical protein QTG56_24015 [Rossellomorea sp. AcN35-11]